MTPNIPLVIENDLTLTLPKRSRRDMVVKAIYETPIPAPVAKGDKVATLSVSAPGVDPIEIPLLAGEGVNKLGLTGRLMAAINYILWGTSE